MTLHQVGNLAFDHFDKVLVLDQGEQVYYGPRDAAQPFMESLGFVHREGGNVADFLVSVTVPSEREIRPGCEITFPRTAYTLRRAYQKSHLYPQMAEECLYPRSHLARYRTRFFQRVITHEKSPRLRPRSPYTVGYPAQIWACLVREYQIILSNKWAFALRQLLTAVLALILGSLFYNEPSNTEGLFLKSGAIFCALLLNTLGSMAEVFRSSRRRSVLLRYQALGFHHPVAHCLAQIVADVPLVILQITLFSLVLYFMIGFNATAGAFFTYWVVLFVTTLVRRWPLMCVMVLASYAALTHPSPDQHGCVPSAGGHVAQLQLRLEVVGHYGRNSEPVHSTYHAPPSLSQVPAHGRANQRGSSGLKVA